MNRTRLIWILFAVAVVAQLGIPLGLIYRYEHVLAAGEPVKFRMAPRDPYDPFRGRYMQLSYSIEGNQTIAEGEKLENHQTAYAILTLDPEGFATVSEVTQYKPWKGYYIKVQIDSAYTDIQKARITIPFDRYYMNERSAPEAERQLAERLRNRASDGTDDPTLAQDYAVVRLLDGRGVIEDLVLDGKSIQEWLH